MKSKVFAVGLLFAMFFVTTSATADNFYFGIEAGPNYLTDSDLDDGEFTIEAEFDWGLGAGGALGYRLDNGMRAEIELVYRSNDFDTIGAQGVKIEVDDGTATSLAFMLNGYYDFKNKSAVTPFVGLGIGFANVEYEDLEVDGESFGSQDDDVFAFQGILGVGFNATQNVVIDIVYKLFATEDPEFDGVEAEYMNNSIFGGVRFNF